LFQSLNALTSTAVITADFAHRRSLALTASSKLVLHRHRSRAFIGSYGQILLIASIVATGTGLDVAATFIENKAHIGSLSVLLATAIPVILFLGLIYALHYFLVRRFDQLHVWLLLATGIVIAASVTAAVSV